MSEQNMRIELYLSPRSGHAHTLVAVRGYHRAAAAEAVRLINEKDSPYEPKVRIFDPSHLVIAGHDIERTFTVTELQFLVNPELARGELYSGGDGRHQPRDRSVDLMLGRVDRLGTNPLD
jgi:hypothetical protein